MLASVSRPHSRRVLPAPLVVPESEDGISWRQTASVLLTKMRKSTKVLLGGAAIAKIAWLCLSPRVATKLYHSKLFRNDQGQGPEVLLDAFNDVQNYRVAVKTVDGTKLRGWYFKHPTASKVWLFFMGRASDIPKNLGYVRMLLEAGASVFIFEYRGFGKSPGKPSIVGVCQDALAAYDCLVEEFGYNGNQIVFYGTSLGAAIAAHVSTVRSYAGRVLQSGFASLESIGKEMLGLLKVYPTLLFPRPLLDTINIVRKNDKPLLIMHGKHDDVIPVSHSHRIFAAAAEPKRLVVLDHSAHKGIDLTDRAPVVEALTRFLHELD